jgi:hypothetical protein
MEQSHYQIRFDWGVAGANAVAADADVIVWVDAIPDGSDLEIERMPPGEAIIAGDFSSAQAVAQWVVELQKKIGRPIVTAVIAAGATRPDGAFRFAVEDLLASGSIINSLGALGLDATSPEAAATEAAFLGLSRAVSHLVSASVSAQGAGHPVSSGSTRVDPKLSSRDVRVLSSGR